MNIDELAGRTIVRIVNEGNILKFYMKTGLHVAMFHEQDCCEDVRLEDVCGDLEDLLNTPLVRAEKRSDYESGEHGNDEWTFYELATVKGSVTLRWYGTSNGYYSTSVSLQYF